MQKKAYYEKMGKNLSVTPARYKSSFRGWKEVDSLALCNAQMHHFFHDVSVGLPKFRSKKASKKLYNQLCEWKHRLTEWKVKTSKSWLGPHQTASED